MKLKPAGIVAGLAGNVALAWGLYHLMGIGSCGGEYPPCPTDAWPYFVAVPLGIIVSVVGGLAGGGGVAFIGTFAAVGVGSIVRGINGGVGPEGDTTFAYVFGALFLLPALLPALLIPFGRRKLRQAEQLVADGRTAIGTVTSVDDTNVTINDNPRIRLSLQIQPEDGSAPFEGSKTMVVSRVDIPRVGDRYPVWYDPANPSKFGIGTGVDTSAAPDVRALFAKAAARQGVTPPTAPPSPATAPVKQDWVNELARLNDLRMSGALSDEEFARAKEKLLAASGAAG